VPTTQQAAIVLKTARRVKRPFL